jgi:alkylation response protein AidB-like acyl-CoA dehydrogenase
VWLAGSRDMAQELARRVSAGSPVSLALTERGHGSDLLATTTTASAAADGSYRITGEKWLINNATRSELLTVLARTDTTAGPRSLSLVLVDKSRLDPREYTCTAKIPTHGVRGADISGIEFHAAAAGAVDLVGPRGGGLAVLLKSFQMSRTVCAALSLGAADQAIDILWSFCQARELYGRHLADLPTARRSLGESMAGLFVAEAVTMLGSRAIGALTGEMSIVSAVVKSFVPTLVDGMVEELSELLGARAFLLDVFAGGRFQKVARDHRIVGIFDGSTFVNQNYLINQFRTLADGYRRGAADTAGLELACALDRVNRPVNERRLALFSRTGCSIVQALPAAVEELAGLTAAGRADPEVLPLARELVAATAGVHAALATHPPAAFPEPEAFTDARRYEWCFAGAACLLLWLHNRELPAGGATAGLWPDGRWLRAALTLVLRGLGREPGGAGQVFVDLADAVAAGPRSRWISVLPCGGERSDAS